MRQHEEGDEEFGEIEEKEEKEEEDWTERALAARAKLQDVDQRIEAEELKFRLLVDEASSRAQTAILAVSFKS